MAGGAENMTTVSTFAERLSELDPRSENYAAFVKRATSLAKAMNREDGVTETISWFHRNLPNDALRCDLLPELPARFFLKKEGLKVSTEALITLLATQGGNLATFDVESVAEAYHPVDWHTQGPKDAKQGLLSALGRPIHALASTVPRAVKSVRKHFSEAPSVGTGIGRVAARAVGGAPAAIRGTLQTSVNMAYDLVRGVKAAGSENRVMHPHSGLNMSVLVDDPGHGKKVSDEVSRRGLEDLVTSVEGAEGRVGDAEGRHPSPVDSADRLRRVEDRYQALTLHTLDGSTNERWSRLPPSMPGQPRPGVRGWLYKLGTATGKSAFNPYKYTSFFWVRRFFVLQGQRLEYALEPKQGRLQQTAGPAPGGWENRGLRGSFDLQEVEVQAVTSPIDLYSLQRFNKRISQEVPDLAPEDVFAPGCTHTHHYCLELKAFGQAAEVLVAPSPEERDRWVQILQQAKGSIEYWNEARARHSSREAGSIGRSAAAAASTPVPPAMETPRHENRQAHYASEGKGANLAENMDEELRHRAEQLKIRDDKILNLERQRAQSETALKVAREELARTKAQHQETEARLEETHRMAASAIEAKEREARTEVEVHAKTIFSLQQNVRALEEKATFLEKHKFQLIAPEDVTLPATAGKNGVLYVNASEAQLQRVHMGSGSDKRAFCGVYKEQDVVILRLVRGTALHEADAFAALGRGQPNLVTFYGFFKHGGHDHLVCELCSRGKLSDVLSSFGSRRPLASEVELEILIQISSGMESIHHLPLIHRDLAARNVMVASFPADGKNFNEVNVKVTDFGLSKEGREVKDSDADSLPVRYMAPETFRAPPVYSSKSDVWAFGVLLWEVLDRCDKWAPYPEVSEDDAVVAGIVGKTLRLAQPPGSSDALWELSQRCRKYDPSLRPTFQDIRRKLENLRGV